MKDIKIQFDFNNVDDFKNASFDQLEQFYITSREKRKQEIAKVKEKLLEKTSAALAEWVGWWKISNFDGTFLGYGYGKPKVVASRFVSRDYKDCYDQLYISYIEHGIAPNDWDDSEKPKFNVNIKIGYTHNLEIFKKMEQEWEKLGIDVAKIN